MLSDRKYEYDVALSFAGEDRPHASQLARILRRRGVTFFYDEYEKHTLWGKNLYTRLSEIYQNKARYCMVVPKVKTQKSRLLRWNLLS